jgi:integrase
MAKKQVADGIYIDKLKSGTNYYARFELHRKTEFVNLTKEYGVKTLPDAKKERAKLLVERQSPDADFIKNDKPVTYFIEAYIKQRPTNERNLNRSQKKIVQNRYALYAEPYLKYVKLGKLSARHIDTIKANLEIRKVGKPTYQKVKTLICSALKDTGINCKKLFGSFEPRDMTLTEKNKKKFSIDEYFAEELEDVAHKFYSNFFSKYTQAKTAKERDIYANLLYLLLTASRSGETSLLKIKNIDLFDDTNNIYIIKVPSEINKEGYAREVKVPKVITPFIEERFKENNKEQYLFQNDIENVLPYRLKKTFQKFDLKESKGLALHIFRALFRSIATDRGLNQHQIDYIMSHKSNESVGDKYYDADKLKPQQRYNIFKLFSLYEKICNGLEPKIKIDYSDL